MYASVVSRRSGFQQAHAGPVAAGRAYPEIVALPDEGDAVAQAGGDVPVDAVVGEVGPPAEKPARAGSGKWRVRDVAGARWGGAPHSRRGEGQPERFRLSRFAIIERGASAGFGRAVGRGSPLDGDWTLGRVEVDLVQGMPAGLPVEVVRNRRPECDGVVEGLAVKAGVLVEAVDVRLVHCRRRSEGRFVIEHRALLGDFTDRYRGLFDKFTISFVNADQIFAF